MGKCIVQQNRIDHHAGNSQVVTELNDSCEVRLMRGHIVKALRKLVLPEVYQSMRPEDVQTPEGGNAPAHVI